MVSEIEPNIQQRATPADRAELQRLKLQLTSGLKGEAYLTAQRELMQFKASRDWSKPNWQAIVAKTAEEMKIDLKALKQLQLDHKRIEVNAVIKSVQDAVFQKYGVRLSGATLRRGLELWL